MAIEALNALHSLASLALASSSAAPPNGASTMSAAEARAIADASNAVQARVDKLLTLGNTRLDFHIDTASHEIVLKIVDGQSGDVLYQIPSDVSLNIAKWLDASGHPLLNKTA